MLMREEAIIIGTMILLLAILHPAFGCDVDNFCVINEAENITITVFNSTNGNIIAGASCKIDVWRGNAQITSQASFTELGSGQYYYTLSGDEINSTGKYRYNINVTSGNFGYIETGRYQIEDATLFDKAEETNITTASINSMMTNSTSTLFSNIWSYATRSLTTTVSVDYDTIAEYVWNFTSRFLSDDAENEIAQKTWNSDVVGTKDVDTTPAQGWVRDEQGNLYWGTVT